MSDSKRQKVDEAAADAADDAHVQDLHEIQQDIDEIEDEFNAEVMKLEKKFSTKKQPSFKKRSQIIEKIPNFWTTALSQHPMFGFMLDREEDMKVVNHLKNIDVQVNDDVVSGYKLIFQWAPNEYMNDPLKIVKTCTIDENGEPHCKTTQIKWKSGKDPTKISSSGEPGAKRSREEEPSFFDWFSPKDQDLHLAEAIKDDIFQNPLKYFLREDFDPSDDFDSEDMDGLDDEPFEAAGDEDEGPEA